MNIPFVVALKIYWSYAWRHTLIYFPFLLCISLCVIVLFSKISSLGVVFFILFFAGAWQILVSRWIMNRLPSLPYLEGRVQLMKNNDVIQKFSHWDAVCIMGSKFWRWNLLFIPFFYFPFMASFFATYWMLYQKRRGRWIQFIPHVQEVLRQDAPIIDQNSSIFQKMNISFPVGLGFYWSYTWRNMVICAVVFYFFFFLLFCLLFCYFFNYDNDLNNTDFILNSIIKYISFNLEKISCIGGVFILPLSEWGPYLFPTFLIFGISYLFSIFTNRFVFNWLSSLICKHGKFYLMRDNVVVEKFNYGDSLGISWWLFWRSSILSIILSGFFENSWLGFVIMMIGQLMIMYWMLQTKRTGAWMAFVPNTHGSVHE